MFQQVFSNILLKISF